MPAPALRLLRNAPMLAVAIFALCVPAQDAFAACCKCTNTTAPGTVVCLTDPAAKCAEIITKNISTNTALSGVTCDSTELKEDSSCKPVTSGGSSSICQSGPTPAATYVAASMIETKKELVTTIEAPKLNVDIPGLRFHSSIPVYKDDPTAQIPFIAQYFSAGFNYLLGIIVIATAVMIIWGGFKYILSSTASGVQNGKNIIKDAVIGMILAFSTVTILLTISPATTIFKALGLKVVQSDAEIMEENKGRDVLKDNSEPVLTKADEVPMTTPYTNLVVPPESNCKGTKITQAQRDMAFKAQQETGIPAAVVLTNFAVESGFGQKCFGPEGKKFNCSGIVYSPQSEWKAMPTCEQTKCPPNGWPAMNCAPKCSPKQPPECYCWQVFDAPNFLTPANIIKKSEPDWAKYNGNPDGFLKYMFKRKWAGTDYGVWRTYAQVMRDQCLLPPELAKKPIA